MWISLSADYRYYITPYTNQICPGHTTLCEIYIINFQGLRSSYIVYSIRILVNGTVVKGFPRITDPVTNTYYYFSCVIAYRWKFEDAYNIIVWNITCGF